MLEIWFSIKLVTIELAKIPAVNQVTNQTFIITKIKFIGSCFRHRVLSTTLELDTIQK